MSSRLPSTLMALLLALPCATRAQETATASARFSHYHFANVLRRYVHDGRFDYKRAKGDDDLTQYMDAVAQADVNGFHSTESRLAFWINAYNAAVIVHVLEHYPISSVREVDGFFSAPKYAFAGKKLSLDHVRDKVIRAQFKEPKALLALNHGTLGSPPLQDHPYDAWDLGRQLDGQVRRFVNSPANVAIDHILHRMRLSEIFRWFRDDFGGVRGINRFIGPYLDDAREGRFLRVRDVDHQYVYFDWTLNDIPRDRGAG